MTALATLEATQIVLGGVDYIVLDWTTDVEASLGDAVYEVGRVDEDGERAPIYPIAIIPYLTSDGPPTTAIYKVDHTGALVDPEIEYGDELIFNVYLVADLGATVSDLWVTIEYVDPGLVDDDRIYTAALLIAAKLWERRNSPVGVVGGFDMAMSVRALDPDVEQLLTGLRTDPDISTQTWPTVADLREHSGIGSSKDDATVLKVLDAAIALVSRKVKRRGVA